MARQPVTEQALENLADIKEAVDQQDRASGGPTRQSSEDLQALGSILASHTRGLDAFLNRQAQRIEDRQQTLGAETTANTLLSGEPQADQTSTQHPPAPADASRSERLLWLLLQHLGVSQEQLEAAWGSGVAPPQTSSAP